MDGQAIGAQALAHAGRRWLASEQEGARPHGVRAAAAGQVAEAPRETAARRDGVTRAVRP